MPVLTKDNALGLANNITNTIQQIKRNFTDYDRVEKPLLLTYTNGDINEHTGWGVNSKHIRTKIMTLWEAAFNKGFITEVEFKSGCGYKDTIWKYSYSEALKICHLDYLVNKNEKCKAFRLKKAHVISSQNQKGGVGKTCFATNVSTGLAINELDASRVLLIDLDPQGQCKTIFEDTLFSADTRTASKYLSGYYDDEIDDELEWIKTELIRPTGIENLYHIPAMEGDNCLDSFILTLSKTYELDDLSENDPDYERLAAHSDYFGENAHRLIYDKLITKLQGEFDFIVIDTSPNNNIVTSSVTFASDHILSMCLLDAYTRDSTLDAALKLANDAIEYADEREKDNRTPLSFNVIVNGKTASNGRKKASDKILRQYMAACLTEDLGASFLLDSRIPNSSIFTELSNTFDTLFTYAGEVKNDTHKNAIEAFTSILTNLRHDACVKQKVDQYLVDDF
ncbi:ParA family protein [Photobacterium leiognathi]|uniref:ParA family protein n=1 Tax=Photobacterium leiognathi TaxID=553611 RepID=UPI0029818C37|nr:ParA family protein [Photobacterium leiognathi]